MSARICSSTAEVRVSLPLHVVDTEGDFGVATGEAVGLGLTGLVAHLSEPLPSTCETTVQVELPDGTAMVTGAVVADGVTDGEGWTYRLVFAHLEAEEIRTISALLPAA